MRSNDKVLSLSFRCLSPTLHCPGVDYLQMISIEGLRPCDFTIPNFPDCEFPADHSDDESTATTTPNQRDGMQAEWTTLHHLFSSNFPGYKSQQRGCTSGVFLGKMLPVFCAF